MNQLLSSTQPSPAVPALFDYQEEMRQRVEHELALPGRRSAALRAKSAVGKYGAAEPRMGRAVMVQMPTGTGKTYLLAAVVADFLRTHKGDVWLIAHRRELVAQLRQTVSRFGLCASSAEPNGACGGRVRISSIQRIAREAAVKVARRSAANEVSETAVPSYPVVVQRQNSIPRAPQLIIIDEAHHAPAATYRALWMRYPRALKVGLTATPCRLNRGGFTHLFDVLLTSRSVQEFIRCGRLALFDYLVVPRHSPEQCAIDALERRSPGGDYAVSEMEERFNRDTLIARLYESVMRYAQGRKGIVYAIDIAHARRIASYYAAHGLRCVALDSRTSADKRDRAVNDFRAGRLDCIVNVNLFDEGFDCPDVEFIQIARPTLSLAKYMQMVGRGLRVHPRKALCVILDHVGLCRSFGLPNAERDWQALFAGKSVGRARLHPSVGRVEVAEEGMEIVVNHSRLLPLTAEAQERLWAGVCPFEQGGRWGLRAGSEVIVRPVYRYISPFRGDYCTFELLPGFWGVLRRNGRRCIPAEFRRIELLPGGDALLVRNEMNRRRVHIATTLTDPKDIEEWWKDSDEWWAHRLQ